MEIWADGLGVNLQTFAVGMVAFAAGLVAYLLWIRYKHKGRK